MSLFKEFSRPLSLLLAALIAVQPAVALAQATPQNTYQVSEEFELTAEDQEALSRDGVDWAEEQESTLGDLFDLAQELEKRAAEYRAQYGDEKLQDLISKNQFEVSIPNVGLIEYRIIETDSGEKKMVPRVVLYRNDTAYLLLDESQLPRDSKHLPRYIAKTLMSSGAGRMVFNEDGTPKKNFLGMAKRKSGRDLIIVSLSEGKMTDLSYRPKPKTPTQWKWWREYFLSKYEDPKFNDFTLAVALSGLLQGGLTLGMTALKAHVFGGDFDISQAATYGPALFSAAFSTFIGTFNKTYRNWTMLSGSRMARIAKMSAVSATYAVGLLMMLSPEGWGDRFAAINVLTAAGFMHMTSIGINAVTNSFTRDYWNQFPTIREKLRMNAGKINFSVFGKPVEWSKATVENQLFYLLPFSINLVSLLTLGDQGSIKVPGTNISIPILQVVAIPFAMFLAKWYSQRVYDQVKDDPSLATQAKERKVYADRYGEAWENSFGRVIRKVKSACEFLLLNQVEKH